MSWVELAWAAGKHLEYLGHPLVADRTYNPNGYRDKEWCPRLSLGNIGHKMVIVNLGSEK